MQHQQQQHLGTNTLCHLFWLSADGDLRRPFVIPDDGTYQYLLLSLYTLWGMRVLRMVQMGGDCANFLDWHAVVSLVVVFGGKWYTYNHDRCGLTTLADSFGRAYVQVYPVQGVRFHCKQECNKILNDYRVKKFIPSHMMTFQTETMLNSACVENQCWWGRVNYGSHVNVILHNFWSAEKRVLKTYITMCWV